MSDSKIKRLWILLQIHYFFHKRDWCIGYIW